MSKWVNLVTLLLILSVVLAACAGGAPAPTPEPEAPAAVPVVPAATAPESSGSKIESAAGAEAPSGQVLESAASEGTHGIESAVSETEQQPAEPQEPEVVLGEGLNFIFVQHALCSWDTYWCDVEEGIHQAAGDMGATALIWGPETFDLDKMAFLINRAVDAGPDGIAVTIPDLNTLRAPIQRALDAGIPVVAYNAGAGPEADDLAYMTYLGSDEAQGGYLSALHLAAVGGTRGVCINHQPGNDALDQRCEGFVGAMEISGLPAEVLEISADAAESQALIADYYANNSDVDIFITLGPTGAAPFYAFMAEAGLGAGDVAHGTFDRNAQIEAHIQDGSTLFAVDQQPFLQGYGALSALALKARYGINPVLPVTPTGPSFVDAETVAFQSDPNRPLTITMVQKALCTWDSFWCTVEDGIEQAAQDMGLTVTVQGLDSADLSSLPSLVDQAVAANPDGLGVTNPVPDALAGSLQRALDAGIEVVAYNAGGGPLVDKVEYLTYYGLDQFFQYQGGYVGGLRLAEEGGVRGVCINHGPDQADLDQRCQGFLIAMQESGLPASILPVSANPAEAQSTIADHLAAKPDTDIVLTLGPAGSTPFYAYMNQAGLGPGDVTHATFDLDQEIIARIQDGTTLFAIDQQPFWQGYGAVQTLMLKLRHGINPVLPVMPTGPSIVDDSNLDVVDDLYQP